MAGSFFVVTVKNLWYAELNCKTQATQRPEFPIR